MIEQEPPDDFERWCVFEWRDRVAAVVDALDEEVSVFVEAGLEILRQHLEVEDWKLGREEIVRATPKHDRRQLVLGRGPRPHEAPGSTGERHERRQSRGAKVRELI